MSRIALNGNPLGTGTVTIASPNTNSDRTVTLPDSTGTLLCTFDGALPVSQGGTGATALTANNVILGNGTSAVQLVAPGANGNVLTSNGTTWVSAAGGGGGGGSTINAVQTVLTSTYTTTSLVFGDVPGLSVSITPSSTASKILILADVSFGPNSGAGSLYLRLARNNSALPYLGDAASGRVSIAGLFYGGDSAGIATTGGVTKIYLDSPATTSLVTYSVQVRGSTTSPGYINRSQSDRAATDYDTRTASSITIIEIRQ